MILLPICDMASKHESKFRDTLVWARSGLWILVLKKFNSFRLTLKKPFFEKKKKNFMAPFYGWGSTASRLQPLRGGSLLFTTQKVYTTF